MPSSSPAASHGHDPVVLCTDCMCGEPACYHAPSTGCAGAGALGPEAPGRRADTRARAQRCPAPRAGEQLLARKRAAELLEAYEARCAAAVGFALAVRPGLAVTTGALLDPKARPPGARRRCAASGRRRGGPCSDTERRSGCGETVARLARR